jgi:hypothetical protein
MNRGSKYIIIFTRQESDISFLGFSIMDSKKASQYMKAVNKLAEDNCIISMCDTIDDIIYDTNDFIKMKVASSEVDILQKIFNIEQDEEAVGFFPDAVTDAYDNGLSEENEDDEY